MQTGIKNKNTIEFLTAGYCYHPEAMVNSKASWKKKVFPAMVGLIKHEQYGYLLFDTGYSERFYQATKKFPNRLYRMATPVTISTEQTLIYQLQERGISADQIKGIFISHFHADHIAGLKDFPSAKFYCSKSAHQEILVKQGFGAVMKGYLKELLPDDFSQRAVYIEELEPVNTALAVKHFDLSYDLLGDKQLMAVPLPGHAKGHFGLMVKHSQGSCFLIGDACWTHHAYSENAKPNILTAIVMDKMSDYHLTISKLRDFHLQQPDIPIIPSHCQSTLYDQMNNLMNGVTNSRVNNSWMNEVDYE